MQMTGLAAKAARHELALVARGGGADKVGNLAVGMMCLSSITSAMPPRRSQNETDAGRFPNARTDIFRGFLYVIAIHQMVPPYSSLIDTPGRRFRIADRPLQIDGGIFAVPVKHASVHHGQAHITALGGKDHIPHHIMTG